MKVLMEWSEGKSRVERAQMVVKARIFFGRYEAAVDKIRSEVPMV